MQITAGSVVLSRSGRDKGTYYKVLNISEDGKFCYLRDGKLHKLSAPKKKNIRHILPISDIVLKNEFSNDKCLSKTIECLVRNRR